MKNSFCIFFLLNMIFSVAAGEVKLFADIAETFRVPAGLFEQTEAQARKRSHYLFQYDDQKRVIRIESRNPAGSIEPDFFNVRVLTFEYGTDGALQKRVWRSPEGTVNLVWHYVRPDRIVFEDAFMAEYPPSDLIPFRDGIFQNTTDCDKDQLQCGNAAGLQLVSGKAGNVIRINYLRKDGTPGVDSMMTAGQLYERDEYGRFTKATLLDAQYKRHADFFGVAEYQLKYEGSVLAEIACFGMDGKPVNNNQGFAVLRQKILPDGRLRISYFGENNEPVTNKEEMYSSAVAEYGFDGRPLQTSFFGTDGQPCVSDTGASSLDYTYFTPQLEMVRLITPDGLPPQDQKAPGDAVTVTRDNFGRIVQYVWRVIAMDDPVKILTMQYTDQGICAEKNLIENGKFPCVIRERRADNGTLLQRTFEKEDGTVLKEFFFEFDPHGTILKRYSPQEGGGFRNILDEKGTVVQYIRLDEQGRELPARMMMKHDGSGRCVETVMQGYPDVVPYRTVYTYDRRGNITREERFTAEGKPFAKGPAVLIRQFDDRGNELLVQGETENGNLVLLEGETYAVKKCTYDDRNRLTAVMWLDQDFTPVPQGNVCKGDMEDVEAAIVQYRYDNADNQTETKLFSGDEDGFPGLKDVWMIRLMTHKMPAAWEQRTLFYKSDDSPAHPFERSTAVGTLTRIDGGTLRQCFFDQTGKPAFVPEAGFAERIIEINTGKNVFYNAEGKEIPAPKEKTEDGDSALKEPDAK